MEIYVKNTLQGLVPLYPADLEEKKHLKLNEEYKVEVTRPRNYQFHKKFMALVNIGWENTSLEMPFDTYRRYLIMKAGYFKMYSTNKGTYYEAESISFANMDQIRFEEVYSRVLDVIISELKVTKQEIEEVLINFM
jgi:hypothetical protein